MTRIVVFILPLFLLLASCASSGAGDDVRGADCCNEESASRVIVCRVLEFSFRDVLPEYRRQMMIGPFRLHGVVEERTLSTLLPPYSSSQSAFSSFYTDGFVDTSVAVYSDKSGFFRESPSCWRLRVATSAATDVDDLVLEINYSYRYGDEGGSGLVTAMQRLPLRAMNVTACRVGHNLPEALLYTHYADECVPFSIVCLCFVLSGDDFRPL